MKKLFVKIAAIALGVTLGIAAIVAVFSWWQQRPKQWSESSLTAKTTQLNMQVVAEDIPFSFQYALSNNTDEDSVTCTIFRRFNEQEPRNRCAGETPSVVARKPDHSREAKG
jgi:hypothetical protein